jgi:hypothetical protein
MRGIHILDDSEHFRDGLEHVPGSQEQQIAELRVVCGVKSMVIQSWGPLSCTVYRRCSHTLHNHEQCLVMHVQLSTHHP